MREMARHMVFGYDGSEAADLALRRACKLMPSEGRVTVVHAYGVPWQVDAYPWFEDFKEACQEAAEEVLAKAKRICADYPVATNFRTAEGSRLTCSSELLTTNMRTSSRSAVAASARFEAPSAALPSGYSVALIAPCW